MDPIRPVPAGARRPSAPALPVAVRLPMLALAFVALAAGAAAGLARSGVGTATVPAALLPQHAVLMVCGFFGTLIALERAVAHAGRWPAAGPALGALGSVLLLAGVPAGAMAAYVAAAAVLAIVSLAMYVGHRASYTLTLAIGAAAWLLGNLAWWLAGAVAPAVPWWMAFLVLTIAGERLELARLRPPSARAARAFAALVVAWLVAAGGATLAGEAGWRALGVVVALTGLWLVVNDIARHTIRGTGLTRYMAACLLSGYAWLVVAGATLAGAPQPGAGFAWDAAQHALMLGFVFSMVLAHAPVILPAVTRAPVAFHAGFYAALALLHASLALRLAGDLAARADWRAWGAAGNAIMLAAFVAAVATGVVRARSASASSRS